MSQVLTNRTEKGVYNPIEVAYNFAACTQAMPVPADGRVKCVHSSSTVLRVLVTGVLVPCPAHPTRYLHSRLVSFCLYPVALAARHCLRVMPLT